MKKYILILSSAVAVFALSGCSGADAAQGDTAVVISSYEIQDRGRDDTAVDIYEDDAIPAEIIEVDILDLDDGYTIEGFSSYGNGVILKFYEGRYSYERTDDNGVVRESFSGYFALQNGAIKIYFGDDDGGGYAIETNNGSLEEGYFYDIIGVRDDITVTAILRGI